MKFKDLKRGDRFVSTDSRYDEVDEVIEYIKIQGPVKLIDYPVESPFFNAITIDGILVSIDEDDEVIKIREILCV